MSYSAANGSFTNLDNFGRVETVYWQDTAGSPNDLDHFAYGYDAMGNRTYRENVLKSDRSELYAHDELDRMANMKRGTLNGAKDAIASPALEQNWLYDSQGNWNAFTEDTDGTSGSPFDLDQSRQHNLGNQIDSINGSGSWVEPGDDTSDDGDGYDDAGNMVYGPQPLSPTNYHVYKYDAWNRLTEVSDSSGTVATYSYDGLNRRVSKTVGSVTTHYYYNTNWQVLCEYLNDTYQLSYVWGLDYIDSPIQREEAGGTILQYLFDANRHITSLHDATSGGIVERYQYDPYGKVTVLHGASDADGAVTEWEKDNGGSDVDNEILFTGMRYDPETGLYHVRNRYWHFGLGIWTQEDKIGFIDGMNLYGGYFVMAGAMDPMGAFIDLFFPSEAHAPTTTPQYGYTEHGTREVETIDEEEEPKDLPPNTFDVQDSWEVVNGEPHEGTSFKSKLVFKKVQVATSKHLVGGEVGGTIEGEVGAFFAKAKTSVTAKAKYEFEWGKERQFHMEQHLEYEFKAADENDNNCQELTCWCIYIRSVRLSGMYNGKVFDESFPTSDVKGVMMVWRIPQVEECPVCPATPAEAKEWKKAQEAHSNGS